MSQSNMQLKTHVHNLDPFTNA